MSKFLTNIFGTKSGAAQTTTNSSATKPKQRNDSEGRLETDALPVDDEDVSNRNGYAGQMPGSSNSTPSASAEMTAAVVRELTDPNYNSMGEMMPAERMNNDGDIATIPAAGNNTISNTMNVHNAQQQLVMQFSNVNQLHFGSVYNFNNANSTSNLSANSSRKSSGIDEMATVAACSTASGEATKRQTPRKTTSIVAMMQSQDEPDHRMFETIATHLGEGWKLVMRNLGHSEGQIEQAIIDHQIHGGIKEVIYQLLLQWVRNADDGEATIARITTLLWEMQHRECVQRMKLVFKSNALRKTSS